MIKHTVESKRKMHQALLKRSYREGGTDKSPKTPEVSFQSIQEELKETKNNNNLENVKYQFFFIFYNTYVNTINQELIYKDVKYLVYNHRKVIDSKKFVSVQNNLVIDICCLPKK